MRSFMATEDGSIQRSGRLVLRTTAFALLVIGAVAGAVPGVRGAGKDARPFHARNVLFLMADDHAPYVMGAYGNNVVRTPNLDRLAAQGARFTRAYVNSPVCSASRQSIITGKLPHATGVTLLRTPLSDGQLTIAEYLKRFGYATGAVGKMHFNSEKKHGFDYRYDRRDYNEYLKTHPPKQPPASTPVRPRWRPFRDPARIWLNADMRPSNHYDAGSIGTWFVSRAVEFLEANRERPFCLWLSFYEPHSPFNFPIEFAGRYDPNEMPVPAVSAEDARWQPEVFRDLSERDKRGIIASYYTSVEYLDKNIGLVLKALERLGLDKNTLVIYVGDHGYLLGHHDRFEKHMMWEEAVRAPLVIRTPGVAPTVSGAMVEFIDLVPTILDVLGVRPMEGLQGESLVPVLTGKRRRHRDRVFCEFLPDNKAMIRTARWKYIFTAGVHDLAMGYATGNGPPGITHRLYDMENDPHEFHDVAGVAKYSGVLKRLQLKMLERFLATHPAAGELPPNLTLEESLVWFTEPPELRRR